MLWEKTTCVEAVLGKLATAAAELGTVPPTQLAASLQSKSPATDAGEASAVPPCQVWAWAPCAKACAPTAAPARRVWRSQRDLPLRGFSRDSISFKAPLVTDSPSPDRSTAHQITSFRRQILQRKQTHTSRRIV